jgi:ABC-type lipoprotein release transport system permease subunit
MTGVVIGAVIASPAGRWIGPMLFRQSPADLRVFALVGIVLLGVAVIASGIPAWRAARVDPKSAMQAD